MTRLDELYAMQREIDSEIQRELAALQRIAEMRDQVHDLVASTRTSIIRVLVVAADAFGLDVDTIRSTSRTTAVVDARHVASWVLHHDGVTYTEIARTFDQDHSTVMNAVGRVNRLPRLRAIAAGVHASLSVPGLQEVS